MRTSRAFAGIVLLAVLAGCGGGGSTGTADANPTAKRMTPQELGSALGCTEGIDGGTPDEKIVGATSWRCTSGPKEFGPNALSFMAVFDTDDARTAYLQKTPVDWGKLGFPVPASVVGDYWLVTSWNRPVTEAGVRLGGQQRG